MQLKIIPGSEFLVRGPVREIHKNSCKNCPSVYPPDPECIEIKALPRSMQLRSVFRCGWRPEKACKGYCDFLGISQHDLAINGDFNV